MSLKAAPFFTDVNPAPLAGAAYWIHASDGVRLRIGAFGSEAAKGTVLMFPGRTEYVEKYGPAAADLAQRGYATLVIDWRGQGLADRILDDARVGHVDIFSDYQKDVTAMVAAAEKLDLPKPFFLIGHSMGGCIGLRSLYEGLEVKASAFTAPMWGIRIAPYLRPVAWALGRVMPALGQGHRLPPGTVIDSYILTTPFEDNQLTRDLEMFDMMRNQLRAHPELALGGPSFVWLREALDEMLSLSRMPSPDTPTNVFLGTNERIVDPGRIIARMKSWKNGQLHMMQDGEHEVLMETAAMRTRIFDTIADGFTKAA
ncbi:alpha/beta fold hydrolase [Tateyamaria pelophila]|uniref:alpha/beta fold hydrolase n=1 Tax=Tateyamaria pelophila TaxID=328415 RepID=UPI001CBF7557|nr:alpha/beta hydrolase [Tateyamaria pelophila]